MQYKFTYNGKEFLFTDEDINDQRSDKSDTSTEGPEFDEALGYTIVEPIIPTPFTEEELNEIANLPDDEFKACLTRME